MGAFPEDKLLRGVRLDEVLPALNAQYMFGSKVSLDQVITWHSTRAGLAVVLWLYFNATNLAVYALVDIDKVNKLCCCRSWS